MKVPSLSSFLKVLVLVVLAGVLLPPAAKAQVYDHNGKFTLTTEVHWGEAVLLPGSYRFSTDSLGASAVLYVFKEGSPAAGYLVPATSWEPIPAASNKTLLVLDQKEGEVYVKDLQLASEGVALHFAGPKLKK